MEMQFSACFRLPHSCLADSHSHSHSLSLSPSPSPSSSVPQSLNLSSWFLFLSNKKCHAVHVFSNLQVPTTP